MSEKPHEWLIREIVREMKASNPLFRELRTLGTRTAPHAAVRVDGYFNRHELAFVQTTSFGNRSRTCLLIPRESTDNRYRVVLPSSSAYEALAFPVFFTHAERGWEIGRASCRERVCQCV